MHEVDYRAHRRDIRLGKHAVAEIEDVTGATARAREDVAHLARALAGGSQERRGVEIALDGAIADPRPRGVERNPPVHADDVTAGRREVFEERRRAGSEVNEGHGGFLR